MEVWHLPWWMVLPRFLAGWVSEGFGHRQVTKKVSNGKKTLGV